MYNHNQNIQDSRQMARNAQSRAMFNLKRGNMHAAIEAMNDHWDAKIAEINALREQFQNGVKTTWNSSPAIVLEPMDLKD